MNSDYMEALWHDSGAFHQHLRRNVGFLKCVTINLVFESFFFMSLCKLGSPAYMVAFIVECNKEKTIAFFSPLQMKYILYFHEHALCKPIKTG